MFEKISDISIQIIYIYRDLLMLKIPSRSFIVFFVVAEVKRVSLGGNLKNLFFPLAFKICSCVSNNPGMKDVSPFKFLS